MISNCISALKEMVDSISLSKTIPRELIKKTDEMYQSIQKDIDEF